MSNNPPNSSSIITMAERSGPQVADPNMIDPNPVDRAERIDINQPFPSPCQFTPCTNYVQTDDERAAASSAAKPFESDNHKLMGPPIPRTQNRPLIAPPAYAFDYWVEDRMPVTNLNRQSTQFLHQSGYIESAPAIMYQGTPSWAMQPSQASINWPQGTNELNLHAGPLYMRKPGVHDALEETIRGQRPQIQTNAADPNMIQEGFNSFAIPRHMVGYDVSNPGGARGCSNVPQSSYIEGYQPYNTLSQSWTPGAQLVQTDHFTRFEPWATPRQQAAQTGTPPQFPVFEGYLPANAYQRSSLVGNSGPYTYTGGQIITPLGSAVGEPAPVPSPAFTTPHIGLPYLNDRSGYYPDQIARGIPSNVPITSATETNQFYSHILEPGVIVEQHTTENANHNMGITYPQQFQPLTTKMINTPSGPMRKYTLHDVNEKNTPREPTRFPVVIGPQNVFDARSAGYGSDDRWYLDTITGQPRFYYDDIDAVRQPNFIIRSEIDHIPGMDHYGVIQSKSPRDVNVKELHRVVDATWRNANGALQNELQERFMRKYNTEIGWQRKKWPLHSLGKTSGSS